MTAADAERAGLVSRVVPADQLMQTALSIAQGIAGRSTVALAKAKECINRAAEVSLAEGIRFEQCVSYLAITSSPDLGSVRFNSVNVELL